MLSVSLTLESDTLPFRNGYNRQGSLDLSLMILDHYAHTGQSGYLGIPVGVVEFYWNLWRNTSTAPGEPMVFFPTQAVET